MDNVDRIMQELAKDYAIEVLHDSIKYPRGGAIPCVH